MAMTVISVLLHLCIASGEPNFEGLLIIDQPARQSDSALITFLGNSGSIQNTARIDGVGVYGIGSRHLFGVFSSEEKSELRRWNLSDGQEGPVTRLNIEKGSPALPVNMAGINNGLRIDGPERFAYFSGHSVRPTISEMGAETTITVRTHGCLDLGGGVIFPVAKPRRGGEFESLWSSVNSRIGIREWDGSFWPFDAANRKFLEPVKFSPPLDEWEGYVDGVGLISFTEENCTILSTPDLNPREPVIQIPRVRGQRLIVRADSEGRIVKAMIKPESPGTTRIVIQSIDNVVSEQTVEVPLEYRGTTTQFFPGTGRILFSNRSQRTAILWNPKTGESTSFDLKKFSRPIIHARFVSEAGEQGPKP